MDYVREELLRQSRALESLMRVGAAEEEKPEQEETAEQRSLSGSRRKTAVSARREEAGGEARLPRVLFQKEERSGALLWEEPAQERERYLLTAGGSALRREERVRELSRAVERDARRYDGGFTMY